LTVLSGLLSLISGNPRFQSRFSLAKLATPPATPPCLINGAAYLDQSKTETYIRQALVNTWGVGNPLVFSPTKDGRLDKIELFASGKGYFRVKVTDSQGNDLTEDLLSYVNSLWGKWVTIDFKNEPVLRPNESYIITFRKAVEAKVYLHRGIYWNWARKIWLKPCLD